MFKTLVWAADGSENVDRTLAIARELVHRDSSAVIVTHVLEPPRAKGD